MAEEVGVVNELALSPSPAFRLSRFPLNAQLRMKRHRSSSVSSQDSEASTSSSTSSTFARSSSSPATKLKRLPPLPGSSSAFTCSLPPTCSTTPAIFSSARDIEAHYSKMHALVCEAELFEGKGIEGGGGDKGKRRARVCGKIFPDRRLMDLVSPRFSQDIQKAGR